MAHKKRRSTNIWILWALLACSFVVLIAKGFRTKENEPKSVRIRTQTGFLTDTHGWRVYFNTERNLIVFFDSNSNSEAIAYSTVLRLINSNGIHSDAALRIIGDGEEIKTHRLEAAFTDVWALGERTRFEKFRDVYNELTSVLSQK
jgi:hypothetical protein